MCGTNCGTILGPLWGIFGTIFRTMLGPCLGHAGAILGCFPGNGEVTMSGGWVGRISLVNLPPRLGPSELAPGLRPALSSRGFRAPHKPIDGTDPAGPVPSTFEVFQNSAVGRIWTRLRATRLVRTRVLDPGNHLHGRRALEVVSAWGVGGRGRPRISTLSSYSVDGHVPRASTLSSVSVDRGRLVLSSPPRIHTIVGLCGPQSPP